MKKSKILVTMCLCASLVLANVVGVCAADIGKADTEMTREELREFYSIDELALDYGMDADKLTEAFYQGVHSEYFSPFSMVESLESSEESGLEYNDKARTRVAYNQDSTMYLETGNNCASGNYPYVGCVAVHKKSSTDKTPIIPFGTRVYYDEDSVNINGTNYESFVVEDTGDANFNRSTYWTDVYGGANTSANRQMAINYGVKEVTISW